ncbi:MAG TPA: YihY/virulence factor BrkB family protein [Kofleriaceae bacterium]|nr:YihY/virulence factor BrkB family protein [Kofleriaceae bacterium]
MDRIARLLPVRVVIHTHRDDAPVLAAGVALFLLLGLLPTMAAVVSVYALVADPSQIPGHLRGLERVVPEAVFSLIVDQLQRATRRSGNELGLTLAGGVVLALYSTRASADAILTGIEHVDGSPPRWRGWRRFLLTLTIAVGALVGAVTVLVLVIAMPATRATLAAADRTWLDSVRWPVLIIVGVSSLSGLYYLGTPARRWDHIVPGALVATALGLAASWGVSLYVSRWASYQSLYGTFGSAMIVILWFYAMSLAVLVGAVFNTELRSPSR